MNICFDEIKFSDLFVLKKGTLVFDYGKTTVISGESGSGKTSLFRYLVNQCDKFSYENLSYLSQDHIFLDDLTIQQHIDLLQTMTGQVIQNIDEYISQLNLKEYLNMYPSQLSGGERNRVGFLLCLCKQTDIIMLDEPTASLNEEYSRIYSDMIHQLKQDHKAIIIFTHDQFLIDQADIRYHIHDKQLNLISEEIQTENNKKEGTIQKKLDILPSLFLKSKKHYKLPKKIILTLLSITMAFSAICFSMSRFIYQAQQEMLSKLKSNEIVVYKPSPHVKKAGDVYTFGSEIPLTQKDIEIIRNTDHVESCEWRVDLFYSYFAGDYDITKKPYEPGSEEYNCFSFYQDGQKLPQKFEELLPFISTYIYEKRSHSDIQLDFENKGVYISRKLADALKKEYNISTDEELKDIEMDMKIPVPIYNTFGRCQGASGDDALQFIYNTTVVEDNVRLPIGGILYNSSMGLCNTVEYAIYVERDIYEEMIEKHKVHENRKLYVIDSFYQNYFVNEVPDSYTGEFNRIFEDNVWTYTAVSVYADGIENIPAIAQELIEKGYAVNDQAMDANAANQGVQSMQKMMMYVSLFLGIIVLLFSIGVAYNERPRNKNMTLYLKQLGLNNDEILDIKSSYYFKDTLFEFIKVMIYAFILFGAICMITNFYFKPSFISFVAIIILVTVTHYILPIIIEKRMLNDKD